MKRACLIASISLTWLPMVTSPAAGASYHVYSCGYWSNNAGPLVATATPKMFAQALFCGASGAAVLSLGNAPGIATGGADIYNKVAHGANASFTATAPPGLTITHIYTWMDYSFGVGDGQGWWGEFYWDGGPAPAGRSGQITGDFSRYGCCEQSFNTQRVGWFIDCAWSLCSHGGILQVGGVDLTVAEEVRPWLASPSGLWQARGWVRGRWALAFYGDSPSGVCNLAASVNGQRVTLGGSPSVGRDQSTWHQCSGALALQAIETGDYGPGAMPLTIAGWDAAGWPVSYTKTIYVDNSQPQVSLSGPTDAPSTAGTQYVTAVAGGSPSGIAGLLCTVDGVAHLYPGAIARVPVSGVGEHSVGCSAANNAVDGAGNHGWSTPALWGLKIGEPMVMGIAFNRMVDKLRCHRVIERVKVPARWVTVRRHHKLVRVHRRAHYKVVKVTRCHERKVRTRILVWKKVVRRGRTVLVKRYKTVWVAVPPRVVGHTRQWVSHGRGTTVDGWLGTASGTAFGGQTVAVLTAPDNGRGRFHVAAVVKTAADGGWSAHLRPGPSRIVQAVYLGGPITESAVSGQVHLVVPAKVKLLSVSPTRVAWGGTVRIVGQLAGGYLPPGGALVRLRIGEGSSFQTYGVQEHVTGSGRFSSTYTFGLGEPSVFRSYWFQIASLPSYGYPWAPAASGKRSVLVGGHPSAARS